jgi:signal transduction histidine kinase
MKQQLPTHVGTQVRHTNAICWIIAMIAPRLILEYICAVLSQLNKNKRKNLVRNGSDEQFSKWIPRFSSLRARLLLLLFLTLLPVYSFILYSVFEARQQAADNAGRDAFSLTRLVVLEQKNLIEIIRQQLITLAQLPIVRRPELATLCNRTFANLLKQNPLYTNLGVIAPDGTLRCSAVPLTKLPNLSDRRYFSATMATRSFFIGDYQIGRVSGKGAVNLAYPVLDAADKPEAVVYIALGLGELSGRLIETAILPENSTIAIMDNHGTILVRQPDPEQWVGKSLPDAPLIKAILAHKQEGTMQAPGVDGVERLYVFKPIYSIAAEQVYVSVGIPIDTVYAGANELLIRTILLMVLVTAAVIALAWVGGGTLVLHPMNALMNATRRLESGDFGARTDLPHSSDEFGQLAQGLDDMAGALQARQSEAVRAEQALQQKDKLLTMVGAMAKVGGWEFDARTLKGTWTDEVARIHDMDPKDPTNVETGIRFYRDESRKIIEAAVKDAIEHTQPYDLELEITTAKGNHKWVRTIGQPVLEDGKVVKVWGSFQDITERKRIEEDILRLNADLDRKVIERTAELHAANKELEAFSYSVSHDLRAPLRAIDGFSQALLEDYAERLDDQARDYLNRVRGATQRMGHLIDDMLTLARVTRAEMHRETVNLSALATEVLAELQKSEPERKVDWRIESGLIAQGDARLLRVALVNLLGNAWKFTGKTATAKIEFGAMRDAPIPNTQDATEFFVRDNGAGFDMAYAGKLFGAFQRLHLTSEFPGTGIGLATVQRIMHRHGGQVRGEGAPGQGATFYFTLPG